MKLITFNPFRTIGLPDLVYVKPEKMFEEQAKIEAADICLFPENWQVTSLVYGMKAKIFPSIESIQLGHSKIEMTRALWSVSPDNIPRTVILGHNQETYDRVLRDFPFPFVAKTVRSSMGRGVYLIENEKQFREYAEAHDVFYIQEYIPAEKDLRVCVIGGKVMTSYWRMNDGMFQNNVAQGGKLLFDDIPQEALNLTLQVAKRLNINHAGFDLLVADDKLYFLEFNVLFGNQGFQQLGLKPETSIYDYLHSQNKGEQPT
ncbi:ATP-grasp domain-containing protein [Shouchella shacheensis]|uniref:ATP-grasp domain-containing protein n=1 Tax=Shouchella shacheensis TaxID=1649580 RepID=UPI000AF0781F|nr:ATP-grasp domain-containing protein [Shouchella shacheensis]